MAKQYLVIKQHIKELQHQAFSTVDEAHKAINKSESFPGDYMAVYDLVNRKIVHMEQLTDGEKKQIVAVVKGYLKA